MSRKMIDYKVEDGKITSIDGYEVGGGTAVEANPQEEATQQLEKIKIDNIAYNIAGGGGGSGGGIAITKFEEKLKTSAYSNLSWNTYDGHNRLEPNTSYNVGDCFVLDYSATFGSETLNENQLIVPESVTIVPENFISSLKFGDVILSLSALSSYPNYITSDNKAFELKAYCYMYFTVIKAGTTSASISLPRAPKTHLKYGIYTIGESPSK